jgi:hypothetical protein
MGEWGGKRVRSLDAAAPSFRSSYIRRGFLKASPTRLFSDAPGKWFLKIRGVAPAARVDGAVV